ncbi:MAG: hypothetical protein PSV40_12225 [Polaromonas sp.]|uniref:hypothetical protein n=1 Tax=Polaromonas sp. TaxID=1869339 RepID=UPI00248A4467|nr:hypothetical protein [Polaromonas sp.]MDI1269853.1 hypothetical protein [Polaromonas sp.]
MSKTGMVPGQPLALTGPGSSLAQPFTRARSCTSTARTRPAASTAVRGHFADDRVGSRLVGLGLIDSQGRVREQWGPRDRV